MITTQKTMRPSFKQVHSLSAIGFVPANESQTSAAQEPFLFKCYCTPNSNSKPATRSSLIETTPFIQIAIFYSSISKVPCSQDRKKIISCESLKHAQITITQQQKTDAIKSFSRELKSKAEYCHIT